MFRTALLCFVILIPKMTKALPGNPEYYLKIQKPHTHYAHVSIRVSEVSEKQLTFSMPVWTPGSYLVREFEKSVENVKAVDEEGNELPISRKGKASWVVKTPKNKTIRFSYDVYAFELSVRTSFIDADHAFLHNTSIFMMVEELKNKNGTVVLEYPGNWKKISHTLEAIPSEFMLPDNEPKPSFEMLGFADYDDLADSPIEIGNQEVIKFKVSGVPHEVAIVGPHNIDTTLLKKDLQKVCETMTAIVGEHPCKKYLFIVLAVENGGGGLEHKNSCTVMFSRYSYTDAARYKSFLGLCAHEYFHLWNVKRIRPAALGPFDYSKENHTNLLWVAEGITSYYDEMVYHRMGTGNTSQFVTSLTTYINSLENRPGSRVQSLAESSWEAWTKEYRPNENSKNTSISYYSKGLVVAALLDVIICKETKGKKSLDDLMRYLWNNFYKKGDRGFSDEEFEKAASEVAGKDLSAFFKQHVYTTQTPAYEEIFSSIGVEIKKENYEEQTLGITTALENGKTIVKFIERNTSAYDSDINVNDEIVSINGIRINNNCDDIIKSQGYPATLNVVLTRQGLQRNITVSYESVSRVRYSLRLPDESKQSEALKKWLAQ